MRLAIVSDIHSNFEALRTLADVIGNADKVVCLGDLVGYYCQVNEVLDYIRGFDEICVLGNHDSFVLRGCPPEASPAVQFGIDFANRVITDDHRSWLASLPLIWAGVISGRSMLFVHGSPWRPLKDYLYAENPLRSKLDSFDYDVIAFGQTHRIACRLERRPYLLNPGSVGQARDVEATACAMVLDTEALTVQTIRRKYDATTVIETAVLHGAEQWIRKHLE